MDTGQVGADDPRITPGTVSGAEFDPVEMRLLAVMAVARHHGFDLDRTDFCNGWWRLRPIACLARQMAARPGAGRQGEPAGVAATPAADPGGRSRAGSPRSCCCSPTARPAFWSVPTSSAALFGPGTRDRPGTRLSPWTGCACPSSGAARLSWCGVLASCRTATSRSPLGLVINMLLHQRKLMNDVGIASLADAVGADDRHRRCWSCR